MADRSIFAEPWQKFLDEFGESPALRGSYEEILKCWELLEAKLASKYEFPPPDTSVKTENHAIGSFWVRSYLPPDSNGTEPVGMYFHGGGWSMGSVDQDDAICRLISKQCRVRVVSVEYRLAPLYKYPIPLDDCVYATKWALEHFSQHKIFLSGGSAGANLAFSVALKLIDQGLGGRLSGVAALLPVTVMPKDVPAHLKSRHTSYEENAENTINTRSAMYSFIGVYSAPQGDVYASPLLHPKLKELPKVYLTEAGADTIRDDSRLMKEALENAEVKLRYDAYPGYPHYSWTFPSKHLAGHTADVLGKVVSAVNWFHNSPASKL